MYIYIYIYIYIQYCIYGYYMILHDIKYICMICTSAVFNS